LENIVFRITEPMTLFTDYLLTAIGLILAIKLFIKNRALRQKTVKLFAATLLLMSLGFFFGGTYHGFKEITGPFAADVTWRITIYLANITSFFLILSGAYLVKNSTAKRRLIVAGGMKLACFLVISSLNDQFKFVLLDYGTSIVILMSILIYLAAKNIRRKAALITLSGLSVAILAGLIQFSGFSPHRYFNNNDLYHVIQIAGTYLIYLGAKSLKDA
jgi:hypothetical protein